MMMIFGAVPLFAIVFMACSKSSPTSPSGSGTFQINMVDSPGAFDAVNIVIDSVQAHIATSDSTSGWVALNSTAQTYDLLQLVNGVNVVIGKSAVPAGQYSQIRFFIGSGSNVVVGGVSVPLTIPSGTQSGLKLNVDATIRPDVTYILTLDFNASQSIVVTGNPASPSYILKPVIRVITTATTGSIAGVVLPATAMPTITAYNSSDTVTTATDTTGAFKASYLSAGTYNLSIVPIDTALNDTTIANINVTAGQTTNLGTITLSHK